MNTFTVEKLKTSNPVNCNEIANLYAAFKDDKSLAFDKSHTFQALICRLHQAVFSGEEKFCDISSTGAIRLCDRATQEILFIVKSTYLPQNLGVPRGEGMPREHLYYLLDNGGFAGVPPTIPVEWTQDRKRTFQWFKENTKEWDGKRTEARKAALRRCAIHHFRTVNMDPSRPNILIPKDNPNDAFPIDGGYCLPYEISAERQNFDIMDRRCLKNKPYLDEPFSEDEKTYIREIDIQQDITLVHNYLVKGNRTHDVLRIFNTANLLLKQAADSFSITLHDLCSIIDINHVYPYSNNTLFQWIAEGGEENEIKARIETIFNEIIRIKSTIRAQAQENSEQCALELIKTIDQSKPALRRLACIYTLGNSKLYSSSNEEINPGGPLFLFQGSNHIDE